MASLRRSLGMLNDVENPIPDTTAPARTVPGWMGAVAGLAAAAVSLAFGQLIEGVSDTIPGLVLGVGELVIDYTPGWAAEESIENLGTAGKGNLLLGITVVSFLLAAVIGEVSLRRGDRFGVVGFAGFGLIGGWATARNPQSPFVSSWFWALVAAGLGIATLRFLLRQARRASNQLVPAVGLDAPIASPLDPPQTRRAFLGFSAGAGAVALTSVGIGRVADGTGAGDLARADVVLPDVAAESMSTTATQRATGTVSTEPFDIPGISDWVTPSTGNQFYRIDTALTFPQVDPESWSLKITGMVDNPYELSYDDILGMDLVERTITLSCVSNPIGGDLVGNAV